MTVMARKRLKPVFTEEELGVNPFSYPLMIKVQPRKFHGQFKIIEGEKKTVEVLMETTPYCKLYSTADHRKTVSRFSSKAKSLFLWLMYDIRHGEDYHWINRSRFMEENEVSLNTLKTAIKELHLSAVITPTYFKDVYWINPEFFFKGDRAGKFPDNVVELDLNKTNS